MRRLPQMPEGDAAVVLRRLQQPMGHRAADAPAPVALALLIAPEIAIEMLVVADLVGIDMRRQVLQHRLVGVRAHRTVKRGRAHFDDTACGELERPGGLELGDRAGLAVLVEEAVVGPLPVEIGPDALDIGAKRRAVLHFFVLPGLGEPPGDDFVVVEIGHQIVRVQIRSRFDERGHRHHLEERLVVRRPRPVGAGVIDVSEAPGAPRTPTLAWRAPRARFRRSCIKHR